MISFEFSNLSLHFLLLELKPFLENALLDKVQELGSDLFKFRIHSSKGNNNLIVSTNAFFVSSFLFPAKQMSSGFGAFLNKHLHRKKILSVEQLALERIIVFRFNEFNLYFEFFGKGNIILTDKNNLILRPLRFESWASRQLKPKESYLLPPSRGLNPFNLSLDDLKNILTNESIDLIRALVKKINLASVFLEQAIINSSLNKNMPANSLTETQLNSLFASLKSILEIKPGKAFLVEFNKKQVLVPFKVDFPLIKEFDSLNSALDELIYSSFSSSKVKVVSSEKKNTLQRKLLNLESGLTNATEKIELNKKKAELIYSNFPLLQSIIFRIKELKEKKIPEKELFNSLKKEFPVIDNINFRKKELIVELE